MIVTGYKDPESMKLLKNQNLKFEAVNNSLLLEYGLESNLEDNLDISFCNCSN